MSSTKSFPPEAFRRHAFVRLDRAAADVSDEQEVREWIAGGGPFVVRRPCRSAAGVFLGLSLPPSSQERRFALEMSGDFVTDVFDPPLWSACPTLERSELAALDAAAEACGSALRSFGSHAWQHLTGLAYVAPTSDIDLLIDVADAACWDVLRRELPAELPPGIDLEIVLKRDAAFSWREFCDPNPGLLFKGNSDVWMGSKSDVHDRLSR